MKKILGILGLLIFVVSVTAFIEPKFFNAYNIQNTIRWTSLFGIISIGAAFVIMTGGIDLSTGSVIGLTGAVLALVLGKGGWSIPGALLLIISISLFIGVFHGLLITKLRLQPFIVTLCGLLFYRGIARYVTEDQSQGFGTDFEGLRQLAIGKIPITDGFALPIPFIILIVIGIVASIFLNKTTYGRYILAVGSNENAVRYSGINVDRVKIVAYVISALLAGIAGTLFALDVNSVQPVAFGNFYELYAIAAAVLGGCSLRGGEGSILGVVIAAAVLRVLYNAINILGIPTRLEFAVIGAVILLGVAADEIIRRIVKKRSR